MWKKKTSAFLLLFASYAAYSAWVYTSGTEQKPGLALSAEAKKGKELWQKNNCSSCHQLYGLGGYLGPDLTTVVSDPARGRAYAAAFIKSGGPTMPGFHFNEQETAAVLAWLDYVDRSVKNNTP